MAPADSKALSEFERNRHAAKDTWDALSQGRQSDRILNFILSPPFGGFGGHINHGGRSQTKICLTFDDGPARPSTERLLDTLGELGIRATFFCVGCSVREYPDTVARAATMGHEIGNHSMYHSRRAGLVPYGGAHIDEAEQAIFDAIGKRTRLYRPPWGWLSPFDRFRLHSRGYKVIGWDVYTRDWQTPEIDGKHLALSALPYLAGGSIMLFHDGYAPATFADKKETINAVRALASLAGERGLEFGTVSEVLNTPAYA